MTILIITAFLLISIITIPQFKLQSENYHELRLERKEAQIQRSIAYLFKESKKNVSRTELDSILVEKMYQISDVQSVNFSVYSLKGNLINSTLPKKDLNNIDLNLLTRILKNTDSKTIEITQKENIQYRSSFSFILDDQFNPLWILNLPYYDDDNLNTYELDSFIIILLEVYLFLLILSIVISYFVSVYITRAISEIAFKMKQTRLDKTNTKIEIKARSKEVYSLVSSYNRMVEMLDESVEKLSKSNKEEAWQEMAKQVAHEIKNPLTPMRLSVQIFQRTFDVNDENIHIKLDQFTQTLVQQIDTMSSIASAFSNFAKMPAQIGEKINIIQTIKLALEIFKEKHIKFNSDYDDAQVSIDRTQIVRIITNLIKNAIEACDTIENPLIQVIIKKIKDRVLIEIKDNGIGISKELSEKIFEPNFTTKSSGMGLGLGMVQNLVNSYGGKITFKSKVNSGTSFTISFPILK
ncbi:MAG: histidine kinase [Cryomorphaceae bacterium BACL29 MAG-121220-bin8]|jgi:two-component system, NtrC family, nitrogen regulation sensor histidine kinase NtrY|nr:MAG: histidine kinase [Cryomorphaceae bacterium BACL29 MAG-121220-bin8]